MSATKPIPSAWSRGRFLLVAALLFAGQAGWVLLVGERPQPQPVAVAPRMTLRLLETPLDDAKLTKHLFAGDPTVFPSSSPHGFADQAWPGDYTAALPEPPPAFLAFTANWAIPALKPAGSELRPPPFQFAGPPGPPPASAPAFPAAEASRPESFLLIEGALAGRQLGPRVVLSSWTNSSLISNSVVQFGVNRAGQVISQVLLAGSGLKEADDSALATVYLLRFRPAGSGTSEFAWDTADFYWKTVEPPQKKAP